MLDVLRGFALLGVFLMNIDTFAGPKSGGHDLPLGLTHPAFVGWHATLDYVIFTVKWILFEGKMRGLFEMLFGASTLLILERIGKRSGDARAAEIFHRRNMWLVVLGLLHALVIWDGDILTIYSTVALIFLYPLKNVSPRKLLTAGVALWLIGGTLGFSNFADMPGRIAQEQLVVEARSALASGVALDVDQKKAIDADNVKTAEAPKRLAAALAAGHEGFIESISTTREDYLAGFWMLWTSGWILEIIGAIMTGMGLFKIGFLSGDLRTRTYVKTAIASYAVAIPLGFGGLYYAFLHGLSTTSLIEAVFYPYMVQTFLATLGIASVLILVTRAGWIAPLTRAFASVGRMAVTNYVFTSILCRFVFNWGPWKLYGGLEYYQYMYVVAIVCTLNLVCSHVWLRFFAFGPVEWLWRSLTYWKLQPMKLSATRSVSAFG